MLPVASAVAARRLQAHALAPEQLQEAPTVLALTQSKKMSHNDGKEEEMGKKVERSGRMKEQRNRGRCKRRK